MTHDEVLIGWMVQLHYQFSWQTGIQIPQAVRQELVALGWISVSDEADDDGFHRCRVSDKGMQVADLNAAEWGIDAINAGPQEHDE